MLKDVHVHHTEGLERHMAPIRNSCHVAVQPRGTHFTVLCCFALGTITTRMADTDSMFDGSDTETVSESEKAASEEDVVQKEPRKVRCTHCHK